MFANDKPVDWLYDIALDVKICNPERGDVSEKFVKLLHIQDYIFNLNLFKDHCERSKSKLKIKYKPSLFQHVGTKSSLKGKTQKLKVGFLINSFTPPVKSPNFYEFDEL